MVLADETRDEIRRLAHEVRESALTMVHAAASGHPGGPLGMADFMATLWALHVDIGPENLHAPDRDRFILGNGHTCAGYYACLAYKGLVPREELPRFRKLGSPLQGHPHRNPALGIDFSTGSLGNSLSVGVGMALAARMNGWRTRVWNTSSDGESQEGQIWEAATSAAHYGVGNLTVIVDFNDVQIDGRMREIMNVRDLRAKYEAFGWHALDVDGHDVDAVHEALCEAERTEDRPSALIAATVLGKGVSFMENEPGWHGSPPNDEQYARAMAELATQRP